MDVEPLGYILLHCFQITGQRKYGLIVKKKYGCFFLFFFVSFSGNNLFMYIIYCLKLQAYLGGVLRGFLCFLGMGWGFLGGLEGGYCYYCKFSFTFSFTPSQNGINVKIT